MEPPEEFTRFCERLARLVETCEGDHDQQQQILRMIEELVRRMNDDWRGCVVIWAVVPDDTEGL